MWLNSICLVKLILVPQLFLLILFKTLDEVTTKSEIPTRCSSHFMHFSSFKKINFQINKNNFCRKINILNLEKGKLPLKILFF